MDISSWALKNSKLIYFLIAVLVIGGIAAFWDMSKLEDPEIKVKQAVVVAVYPGASSYEVELEVTDALENSIKSMEQIDQVVSSSYNDMVMIEIRLKQTVPDDEVEQTWDILRRKVNDTKASLPAEVSTQVIDNFGDVYGMFYAVTSDGYTEKEMDDYVNYVKREVQSIEGISAVSLYGIRNECINVELYQDRMANLGVHLAEVLATLNGQNQTIYSGFFNSDKHRVKVSVNDKYKTVDDVTNLIIQGHENDQLKLGDIAKVSKGYDEPVRNQLFYDGQHAYGMSISAQSGTDITKLGKAVDDKLSELQDAQLPTGISFHKVFNQPEKVKNALTTFLLNLLESLVIVIIVLMFTMGFKSGVIIGINLFIIVIGTIFVLNTFEGTLQRVSLGSFILAMGMLVDNAIVIIDGIIVDLKSGKSRHEAMISIGKKTALPLLGATLIAILAFFPIFLSPDTAGVYIRDLFIVLAVSLLLSWILALTLVPIHANHILHPKVNAPDDNQFDSKYYRLLRNILTWTLKNKFITVAAAIILVLSSVYCYRLLPQGFFPDMGYNQLYIEYKLPEGNTSEAVKNDLDSIEKYLKSKPDVTHITMSLGGTPSRYNLVRSIATPSLSYGELIVDYKSPKALVKSIEETQKYLTETYPEAFVRVKRYNLMYKKFPIELQFKGPDPAVLKDLTDQAENIMRANPKATLVCNDWEPEEPTLVIDYNQATARNLGISRSDVGLSLLMATEGIPIGTFYEGKHKHSIYLKCVNESGEPIENLSNVSIFGMIPNIKNVLNKDNITKLIAGKLSKEDLISDILLTVPLNQATNGIDIEWRDPVVHRSDGERSMQACCEPAFGYGPEEVRQDLLPEINKIKIPTGYSMHWEGEYKASTQSTKYLFKNFPLAVMLMITILIMLFKDFRKPLIIFCCIPLLFVGVVYGMLLSGKMFGFVAIVGVLGLIGMIIKNGVILMDEISLQLESGVEPVKALLDSSSIRFRPVMMASLTTILGMIPLLTDDLFGSLAVTIMCGLFVGTIIILLFIPVLYALFFRIKIKN